MHTHEVTFTKSTNPEDEMKALAAFLAAAGREGIETTVKQNGSGDVFVTFTVFTSRRNGPKVM